MRIHTLLAAALALAAPSLAMAQAAPTKSPPAQTGQAGKHAESKKTQPTRTTEARQHAEVKGHVLPIAAGIESAQACAGALHELTTTEPFERRDARQTAELAEQAVRIAHERAATLGQMKGLSSDARADAKTAANKLKEARSTVERIQRQVGVIEGAFRRNEVENVRNLSTKLHEELRDAQQAMQKVADSYRISMTLEMPERVPVRGHD